MTRLWAAGEPVQVVVRDDGVPVRFQLSAFGEAGRQGGWHEVAFIANRWRVHTTWWLPEADASMPKSKDRGIARRDDPRIAASREYFKLVSTGGLLCTLYRDLRDGAWYCARVYD